MNEFLSTQDEERLVDLIAGSTDTGWREREDGSWSRLVRFEDPVPQDLYAHVVQIHYLVDPPAAMMRVATTHSERLSKDRRLLHLSVQRDLGPSSPHTHPVSPETSPVTTNLFGPSAIAAA